MLGDGFGAVRAGIPLLVIGSGSVACSAVKAVEVVSMLHGPEHRVSVEDCIKTLDDLFLHDDLLCEWLYISITLIV